MPEYTLDIYNGSIELNCDECGHVNHWEPGVELEEVFAHSEDHSREAHGVP